MNHEARSQESGHSGEAKSPEGAGGRPFQGEGVAVMFSFFIGELVTWYVNFVKIRVVQLCALFCMHVIVFKKVNTHTPPVPILKNEFQSSQGHISFCEGKERIFFSRGANARLELHGPYPGCVPV